MIPHSRPTVGDLEAAAAAAVIHSGQLAQGRQVEAFEAETAERLGRRHAVAVSSGTAALMLTLRALDVKGGRVLLPSYVCSALLHAVHHAGATAVLADVDRVDGNLHAEPAATDPGMQAVVIPHLFGQPASIDSSSWGGAAVVEDLAMALGCDGVGTAGVASICSFYATKMITSGGEGGMVVGDDDSLIDEIRSLREYDGHDPQVLRWNAKLTDVSAAIGRVQLRRLDEFVATRRGHAHRYHQLLQDTQLTLPPVSERANGYRFVVQLPDHCRLEDALIHMRDAGVICHRPIDRPLHRWLRIADAQFPASTLLWETSMSVPIYPSMTAQQQDIICAALRKLVGGGAS
jgi:perosamine synthetase